MANFETAYLFLAPHEYNVKNVYSNDPNDKGGETKYGISKARFPDEDIKNLSLARAKKLTKQHYWDSTNLGKIHSQAVANTLLDFYFHSGTDEVKRIQRLLNSKFGKDLAVDGVQGNLTTNAINSVDPTKLGVAINMVRLEYLKSLSAWKHYSENFSWRVKNNFALFAKRSNPLFPLLGLVFGGLVYLGMKTKK